MAEVEKVFSGRRTNSGDSTRAKQIKPGSKGYGGCDDDMAKAITDAKAFHALLGGGYICEKVDRYAGRWLCSVLMKDETAQTGYRSVGHITRRQLVGFVNEGVVVCIDRPVPNRDKYGNVYHYYELSRPAARRKPVVGHDGCAGCRSEDMCRNQYPCNHCRRNGEFVVDNYSARAGARNSDDKT